MAAVTNPWCTVLGIDAPRLEAVKDHRYANAYTLLIVALLERGEPMTLPQVAARFESAGVTDAERALCSLRHCRPARLPVCRDGDRYHIDPDNDEIGRWIYQLGLLPLPSARTDEDTQPAPEADLEAQHDAWAYECAERAAAMVRMRRALLYAFPEKKPEAIALLDVGERALTTFIGDELAAVRERLQPFDLIGAIEVRTLLRALDFDPGTRRLADIGPPQKTKTLNERGRRLRLTTKILIQGSCGISRPFGDKKKLASYLRSHQHKQLRRRLEADVKSLYALYQYGCLHGYVRLRWGSLDKALPAPWVRRYETLLDPLKHAAIEACVPLEVVIGAAPAWIDPWTRAIPVFVELDGWRTLLIDQGGYVIADRDVQLARLSVSLH